MPKIFYVTGTDTDVGKTLVSAALLQAFNNMGLSTAAMKPIASGCERVGSELQNADALLLQGHASIHLPYATVNPFAFEPAIAPHIAAQEAQVKLSAGELHRLAKKVLTQQADVTVVEGAGGYYVPLSSEETLADFAKALGGEVILVVAIRLGCINHALLSAKAIEQDGLKLAGWVANFCEVSTGISIGIDERRQAENIASIQERINAPMLAKLPRINSTNELDKITQSSLFFSNEKLQSILQDY